MVAVGELAAPAVVCEPERLHVAQVGRGRRLGPGPVQFEDCGGLCRSVDAGDLRGGPGPERFGVHGDDVTDGDRSRWFVSAHARTLAGYIRDPASEERPRCHRRLRPPRRSGAGIDRAFGSTSFRLIRVAG